MERASDHSHHVRRVVLPSGREIEVVYFDQPGPSPAAPPAAPGGQDRPTADQVAELHVCPECALQLVYPTEWQEVSTTHWEVDLRCPNCEWLSTGVYDQDSVDRFDEELDHGTEALLRDLKRLTRANMEVEVERFSHALDSDAIWPMDF